MDTSRRPCGFAFTGAGSICSRRASPGPAVQNIVSAQGQARSGWCRVFVSVNRVLREKVGFCLSGVLTLISEQWRLWTPALSEQHRHITDIRTLSWWGGARERQTNQFTDKPEWRKSELMEGERSHLAAPFLLWLIYRVNTTADVINTNE